MVKIMISFVVFSGNLKHVRNRIADACAAAGRAPDEVTLLPVTKNHPPEAVLYAARAGLAGVGENRVQEAAGKRPACAGAEGLRWELIGHLQSNKVKEAVRWFDRVQSVDSVKLVRRLSRAAEEAERVMPVLLQCNAGEDPAKYGLPPGELDAALEVALGEANVRVEGLMTIAPLGGGIGTAARAFEKLRSERDRLADGFGISLAELSMGMTGDLEAAIAAGSTQIRVGTALYGERDYGEPGRDSAAGGK